MSYLSTAQGITGLVSAWLLADTTSTAGDAQGNVNGTYQGTAGVNYTQNGAGGPSGLSSYVHFDGTTGQVTTTSNASLSSSLHNAVSVVAWGRTTSTKVNNGLLREGNFGYFLTHNLQSSGVGKAQFAFYDSGAGLHLVTFGSTSNDGNWHMLTGTWNGTTLAIYVDNNTPVTATPAATMFAPLSSVHIGNDNQPGFWSGDMCGVLVYNVALSSTNVSDLFAAGTAAGGPPDFNVYRIN